MKLYKFLILLILSLFCISSVKAQTVTTFSDTFDFGSYIDQNYSRIKLSEGKIFTADDSVSSRVESQNIASTYSYDIARVRFTPNHFIPSGAAIIYYISSTGGNNWTQVDPGSWKDLPNPGKTMRWAAVLAKSSSGQSPYIDSIKIEYQLGGENMKISNDSRRASDLRSVAYAIERYQRDNGNYPNVSADSAESRWRQLGEILTRINRTGFSYISPMPQPISSIGGDKIDYDYKNSYDGYVVFTRFESSSTQNWELSSDIDETFVIVDCKDPVFCIVGGSLEKKSTQVVTISGTSNNSKRLIRAFGDSKIYYITHSGYKRHIPNPQIFSSYGNKWTDVIDVDPSVVSNYQNNNLIYLEGDPNRQAYYLRNGIKHSISNFTLLRMNVDPNKAAPLNKTEFNYYSTGPSFESTFTF